MQALTQPKQQQRSRSPKQLGKQMIAPILPTHRRNISKESNNSNSNKIQPAYIQKSIGLIDEEEEPPKPSQMMPMFEPVKLDEFDRNPKDHAMPVTQRPAVDDEDTFNICTTLFKNEKAKALNQQRPQSSANQRPVGFGDRRPRNCMITYDSYAFNVNKATHQQQQRSARPSLSRQTKSHCNSTQHFEHVDRKRTPD